MSKLLWDQTGERYFEAGIKNVALFVMNSGVYGTGVAWSGVTKVSESPDGADATELWADDIKYAVFRSAEKFKGSIEAYTYPDEWAECDGSVSVIPGFTLGQQARKVFGLVYKTTIGNDTDGFEKGYKLHIVYGATASPSSKDFETINDSPDAITFSWDFETTPINIEGYKATAHLEFDSTKIPAATLKTLEDILYGTNASDPRLPLPDEIIALMAEGTRTYAVKLNTVGGTLAAGKDITSYQDADLPVTLPVAADVTKEGYTFAGWVEVNDVSTVVTTIPAASTGDKEYIATYTST